MAASVYATPPPDLSSEDTALSDVSNSSQISSSSSQSKAIKRNLSTSLLNNHGTSNSFDSVLIDQSKKRRKQSTPIRISALNLSTAANSSCGGAGGQTSNSVELPKSLSTLLNTDSQNISTTTMVSTQPIASPSIADASSVKSDDSDPNFLQKIYLPGLNQTKGSSVPEEVLSESPITTRTQDNISNSEKSLDVTTKIIQQTLQNDAEPKGLEKELDSLRVLQPKECNQCGEEFNSDIKLDVHTLHHHAVSASTKRLMNCDQNEDDDEIKNRAKSEPMEIKIEPDTNETNSNDERSPAMNCLNRPEEWLTTMPRLNFPFAPEAAAVALSASSYLSQLPLLTVPPVGAFHGVEGISRPPLRIFNPEAYCDLCNKEFCNKYFLKTHKANKHGIYDPAGSVNDMPTGNQMSQLSQVLQMQFQQQQQQLQLPHTQTQQQEQQQSQNQQQQQISLSNLQQTQQQLNLQPQQQLGNHPLSVSPQPIIPPETAVHCDICNKRFMNVFAMKRHRHKVHEIPPPTSPKVKTESELSGPNEKECSTQKFIRMPDGFREDYSVEQEDVSFTPQPRKLSPFSSQQARESNFSVEKLKRLGVVNPEAFCDLCCKEYCNKYFLRTHKLKRHGILVPDDTKDEIVPWQFVQTTPLNLMIGVEKVQRRLSDSDDIGKISVKSQQQLEDKSACLNGVSEEDKKQDSSNDPDITDTIKGIPENPNQDPEAISVDLQKLQSMILQLNDLSGQRPMSCNFCGREFENQYILHAHVVSEHSGNVGLNSVGNGNLLNNLSGPIGSNNGESNNGCLKTSRTSSPSLSGNSHIEICKQCDKEFSNTFDLRQHVYEVHGTKADSPIRDGFITPERPVNAGLNLPSTLNQNEKRPPYTITPTSSYCEICNKELCNKYFMKTHMQRMHGIEIENGAQIGGVVCNICNKELCSKYFLRVHKHNTHGIVDEGSPLPQSRQNGDQPDAENIFPMDNIKSDLADLNNRYFSHYTQVCPLCSRRFRSSKWLREHLMNDHGKTGTEKLRELEHQLSFTKPSSPTLKIPNGGSGNSSVGNNTGAPISGQLGINSVDPSILIKGSFPNFFVSEDAISSTSRVKEYQCSFCSFSTPYYAFLFIHERSSHAFGSSTNQIKSEAAVSLAKDEQRLHQPSTTIVTSCATPTTTTPASTPIPQTPQENANSIKRQEKLINHPLLSDLANLAKRPASYAVPQSSAGEMMQSFLIEETNRETANLSIEENDTDASLMNRFVPALVFLPVKERISGPVTVSFTLTPA